LQYKKLLQQRELNIEDLKSRLNKEQEALKEVQRERNDLTSALSKARTEADEALAKVERSNKDTRMKYVC